MLGDEKGRMRTDCGIDWGRRIRGEREVCMAVRAGLGVKWVVWATRVVIRSKCAQGGLLVAKELRMAIEMTLHETHSW